MTRTPKISVAGAVLRWAREQRGLTPDVAAKRLQISEPRLMAFEAGEDQPSVAQLKNMSDKYKRPLIVLLLDEPPTTFTPLRDFRMLPSQQAVAYSPQLRDEMYRAVQQQEIYADLSAELGHDLASPALPTADGDPHVLAAAIRSLLGVSYSTQRTWTNAREALGEWRSRVEGLGVLVLEASDVAMKEMRGFSLSERQPFVIVLNGQDSERGKVFTLLHELAHLCLRSPGVCDLHQRSVATGDTEVFCNAVAGEAVLPRDVLTGLDVVRAHRKDHRWSDEELEAIQALAGGASKEAILRRLLQVGLATAQEYEEWRDEFLEKYEEWRRARSKSSKGGPPPHRIQLRDRGRPFVRSVLDAYGERIVSLSEVVDLVGVRTKHLEKLQREAFR